MARRTFLFRTFECPDGHVTKKFVEAHEEAVLCEVDACPFAALRPEVIRGGVAVHGDALDYVDHNLGPDPVHITSKTQRRALMAATGRREFIRHTPVPGSDRSPYTTSWGTMDPKTLANATELVTRRMGNTGEPEPAPVANSFNFEATPEQAKALIELMETE